MSDQLADYLASELGLELKPPRRAGLRQAITAFLGPHLEQPTPIQAQAIEVIYDGADALLISATASGKTEAAVIPIAARLMRAGGGAIALYIAPTRALLNDLHRRLEAPLHRLGLEARVRHGERPLPKKVETIRVLFTTPESLDVLLSKNSSLLRKVKYVIVDEIHQIFGTPRGDQLGFLLQRLEHFAGDCIQRVALSATVGDPTEIAEWLCPQQEPAQVIATPDQRSIVADFCWLTDLSLLRQGLVNGGSDKILIFVNSRRRCDDVYLSIRDLEPYDTFVHYSTLTKAQREYVERGFKSAPLAVCVATTTLELGIDIGSIQKVVLIDAPHSVSSFLQRIGRGGRRGDSNYVTVTPSNALELLRFAAMLWLAENSQVETGVVGHPHSVLNQQIFSIIAGKSKLRIHPDNIADQFSVFNWLQPASIEAMLERLVDKDLLRRPPERHTYEVGPVLEDFIHRRHIYTNILGQGSGTPVFHEGRILAHLPLRPNQITHGNVILFAGRFWRIISISDRGLTVEIARPVPMPVRPVWGSRGAFAASPMLAQGMRSLLLSQPDLSAHQFDQECARQLELLYSRVSDVRAFGEALWYERTGTKYVTYTFAGALENQVLRMILHANGMPCEPRARAEEIALLSEEPLNFDCLPDSTEEVEAIIASQWRRFAGWINTGPFFEYLPAAHKQDETLAQVANKGLIETVKGLRGSAMVPVDLQLV